jgi:siroheme synthase
MKQNADHILNVYRVGYIPTVEDVLVDPDGNFVPGLNGCPQLVRSIGPDGIYRHTGPARVFPAERLAMAAIKAGAIREGDVLVLAGIGPMGTGMEETYQVTSALKQLPFGGRVALVTDAGTPGISDPGERLVRAVVDAGFDVSGVPGPAAFVLALVLSGLPTGRFVFEGFLPRKGRERADRLAEIAAEPRTTVLYEAPHRLARTLLDLAETCGADRRLAVGRELTKLHEEMWRGDLGGAHRAGATRCGGMEC